MVKFLSLAFFLVISVLMYSQVPQGIPYQAVIRDTQGTPILNQSVSVKFSLHDQTADGAIVYEETHSTSTNGVGLFSLTFGAGVATTGTFTFINWSNGYKFLQVQTNIGSGFVDNGTQQLMAVPYALYAGSAGSTQVSNPDVMRLGKGFTMVSQISSNVQGYQETINYCATLVEGGYDDWRLPTYEEAMNYITANGVNDIVPFIFNTTTIFPSGGTPYFMRIEKDIYDAQVSIGIAPFGYFSTQPFARKCSCVR
jgi:hypothetical protein